MTACAVCGRLMRGFGISLGGALGVHSAHCSMRCLDTMYALVKMGRKPQFGLRTAPLLASVEYVGPWILAQSSTDLSTYTGAQVHELVRLVIEGYANAAVEELEREAGREVAPHQEFQCWHNEDKAFRAAVDAGGAYLGSQPTSDLAQFSQTQCVEFCKAIINTFIQENDADIPF